MLTINTQDITEQIKKDQERVKTLNNILKQIEDRLEELKINISDHLLEEMK